MTFDVPSGKLAVMLRYASPADPEEFGELGWGDESAEPELVVIDVAPGPYVLRELEAATGGIEVPVFEEEPDGETHEFYRVVIRPTDEAELERSRARILEKRAAAEREAEAQQKEMLDKVPAVHELLVRAPSPVERLFVATEGDTVSNDEGRTVRLNVSMVDETPNSLPPLGALANLESLKVLAPLEGGIDAAIGKLPLTTLDLGSWTGLTRLPAEMGLLESLQKLMLPHSVESLPFALRFPNLETLQISLRALWSAEGIENLLGLKLLKLLSIHDFPELRRSHHFAASHWNCEAGTAEPFAVDTSRRAVRL